MVRMQPLRYLDFNPVRDFWPTKLLRQCVCVVLSPQFAVVCYSSRKLTQQERTRPTTDLCQGVHFWDSLTQTGLLNTSSDRNDSPFAVTSFQKCDSTKYLSHDRLNELLILVFISILSLIKDSLFFFVCSLRIVQFKHTYLEMSSYMYLLLTARVLCFRKLTFTC